MISGTNAITESAFLVRKVAFRTGNLLLVKVGSATAIHVFFVGVVLTCCASNGIWPTLAVIQILYYFAGAVILTLGISLITASLVPFMRDI
jgi:ABC-type polysaccharide/polyol phosphate export permease